MAESMFREAGAQSSAHKKRGVVLCFLALFLGLSLLCFSPALARAADDTGADNQFLVIRVFYQVADWTARTWRAVKIWVIEQSTHIAQAFVFWSKEPVAKIALPEPQALGEEASQPQIFSPLTYRTELSAPEKIPEPAAVPAPFLKFQEKVRDQENTNPPAGEAGNQFPILEPDTTLVEQTPIDVPSAPTEIIPSQPETIPIPDSTPELLPAKKQSSSYYIPILARDTIAPTSQVSPLATTTTSNIFTVSWTGEDMDITSTPAVASFDIQYQVDSGDWTDWLLETTLLSSLFTTPTSIEKIYGFRSRARDRYGNLETYPESADTSIYVNLLAPNLTIDTPASGSTLLSTTADENPATGDIEVTISGAGDNGDIITITLGSPTATTTVESLAWSKQVVLAEGANNFTIQAQETDGDTTTNNTYTLTLELVPTHDVVINEIAWMGTQNSTGHEWMELYNASSTAISLSGWTLHSEDGKPDITLNSGICSNLTIPSKGYFLLEKTTESATSVASDCVYSGLEILDNEPYGELLRLRQASGFLVDQIGSTTVAWFAGNNSSAANRATMERKDPTGDGTLASNWATNDGALINGQDAGVNNIKGTPKSLNSQNTTITRVVTNLQQQYIYTTTTSVRLYWTTPKTANLATTTPATYDIRYRDSGCPITESNWSSSAQVMGEPTPSATQDTVATTTVSSLTADTAYCFAMKTSNGVETSGLSNVATVTTEDGNSTLLFSFPGAGPIGTLASSSSPYLIKNNVTIAVGNTLVIQPGIVVKMDGNYTFTVNGTLTIGSASDNVNGAVITSKHDDTYAGVITGSNGSPAAGDWGIITGDAGTSALTFNNAIIRYGGFLNQVVRVQNGAQASITRSIIEYSNSHGIIISDAATNLTFSNSIVRNTLDVGLRITNSAQADIQGSTFTGNRRGINVDAPADETSVIITGNNFYSNNATSGNPAKPNAGVHYEDADTLTATNNWWGSADGPIPTNPVTAPRDAAMFTAPGVIDYSSYATTAFTILPSGL